MTTTTTAPFSYAKLDLSTVRAVTDAAYGDKADDAPWITLDTPRVSNTKYGVTYVPGYEATPRFKAWLKARIAEDCAEVGMVDITTFPGWDRLVDVVWDDFHGHGYREVLLHLEEHLSVFDGWNGGGWG